MQKKKNSNPDIIIIGAGLVGLCTAKSLLQKGHEVLILEGSDVCGGYVRGVDSTVGVCDNGLRHFAGSEASLKALRYLKSLSAVDFEIKEIENNPMTYDSGTFKDFVGFGDKAPPFHEPMGYFLTQARYEISIPLNQVVTSLINELGSRTLKRSYCTKVLETEGKVSGVMVNGNKQFPANTVIFCGTARDLAVLSPDACFSAKAKQKIFKGNYWSAVCLDLFHKTKVTDHKQMHLLDGTTQDELGPCVGLFHDFVEAKPPQTAYQQSQWVTFVDRESVEEAEVVGLVLKKIKKQLKRAYPLALDELLFERILVAPNAFGAPEIKVKNDQSIASLEGLYLGSAAFNKQTNLTGALLQSGAVVEALSGEEKQFVGKSGQVLEQRIAEIAPSQAEEMPTELNPILEKDIESGNTF